MRVLLLGATGMVGQGVLRECLRSNAVQAVLAPVRERLDNTAVKLTQVQHKDFFDWTDLDLTGMDACFFCLGTTAVGKTEAEYRRITYDITLRLAEALVAASPQAVFVYVSGQGTRADGRAMWARVKGETENALLRLPFRKVYCFRPGYIQPMHGIRSRTKWYNLLYRIGGWTYPLLHRLFPNGVTTTEVLGRAMLAVASEPLPATTLSTADINRAAAASVP